jgi:hypothetical protein
MSNAKSLTHQQKLEALSLRFYQGLKWTPKAGDYYTTSRADLELYQVVAVEGGQVKTRYCDTGKSDAIATWPVDEFPAAGFGPKRVWVPDFVLKTIPADNPAVAALVEAVEAQLQYMDTCNDRGDLERNMRAALRALSARLADVEAERDVLKAAFDLVVNEPNKAKVKRLTAERDAAEAALCQIRDMETPFANATVRRIAQTAKEALK